jgi:hypothetical protein
MSKWDDIWYQMKGFVYPSKPKAEQKQKICTPDYAKEQHKIIDTCSHKCPARAQLECIKKELKQQPDNSCFYTCIRFGGVNNGWMDLGGRGEDGFLFDTVDCSELCLGKQMEYRNLEPWKSFHERKES